MKINEGDGEVDENFWAQAAADQAAGLRSGEADESAWFLCFTLPITINIALFVISCRWRSDTL